MNKKNKYFLAAGAISSLVTLLHLIGGQITLVNPLLRSPLPESVQTEWLGAWHMVSLCLILMTIYFFRIGLNFRSFSSDLIHFFIQLNALFIVAFLLAMVLNLSFAPQWIFFLPIFILLYLGNRKYKKDLNLL